MYKFITLSRLIYSLCGELIFSCSATRMRTSPNYRKHQQPSSLCIAPFHCCTYISTNTWAHTHTQIASGCICAEIFSRTFKFKCREMIKAAWVNNGRAFCNYSASGTKTVKAVKKNRLFLRDTSLNLFLSLMTHNLTL